MALTAVRTASPFWPRNTLASTVTAAGDALTTATGQAQSITCIRVTCSGSALTLTSTPTLHAGFQGQPMEIMNVGSNVLTLLDEQFSTGSLLKLGYPRINLAVNQSIQLSYSTDLAKWVMVSAASNLAPGSQVTFGGGGQASAVQLFWPTNLISNVSAAGDSVKLWPATGSGLTVRVANATTSFPCDLFTSATEAFDGMTNNQQISIAPGTGVTLVDAALAMWRLV